MFKKAMLILLFFSGYTHAYLCQNKITGETFKGGDQNLVVYLDSDIADGENRFANVGDFIECKNELPLSFTDYLDLESNGVLAGSSAGKFGDLTGGVYINNRRFIANQDNEAFNVFTFPRYAGDDYHPIDIELFFAVTAPVGPYIEINPGDELMVLKLHSYSDPAQSVGYYKWHIIAGNRVILATGTCEINNGEPIEVDFGNVGKSKVKTAVGDSLSQIHVNETIYFDCDNSGIDMDINISLSATPTSFSSDAFETTTGGLGVVMLHDNVIIPPFDKFSSKLEEGQGSEDLSFTLIKTPNPEVGDLTEGFFSASASLIISIQ